MSVFTGESIQKQVFLERWCLRSGCRTSINRIVARSPSICLSLLGKKNNNNILPVVIHSLSSQQGRTKKTHLHFSTWKSLARFVLFGALSRPVGAEREVFHVLQHAAPQLHVPIPGEVLTQTWPAPKKQLLPEKGVAISVAFCCPAKSLTFSGLMEKTD